MGWRNKIDVMTALRSELEHDCRQSLVGNLVFDLFFVSLGDLVVLAINAT